MSTNMKLAIVCGIALLFIYAWMTDKVERRKLAEFRERDPELYNKQDHCTCSEPDLVPREEYAGHIEQTCLKCGYEFTDESNLLMRE